MSDIEAAIRELERRSAAREELTRRSGMGDEVARNIISPAPAIPVAEAPDMTEITEAVKAIRMPELKQVEEILSEIKTSVDTNKPAPEKPLITGFRVVSRGFHGDADVVELIYEGAE